MRSENDVARDANRLLRDENDLLQVRQSQVQAELAEVQVQMSDSMERNGTLEARVVDLGAHMHTNSKNS